MTDPSDDPSVVGGHGYADLSALMTLMTGDEKHGQSATSTLDVLWVLYDRVLSVDPARPDDPDRDRFLLSRGHGPVAYYAVLAAKGFIPLNTLPTFGRLGSILGHHPDRVLVPGVEISSGSLGHGMPLAVGVGLGLRAQGRSRPRVVCLVGDAELDEGSNHEAIAFAGATGLASLTVIVIDNHSARHGWRGGVGRRFAIEGWSTCVADGHDHRALEDALTGPNVDGPHVVVATVEPRR